MRVELVTAYRLKRWNRNVLVLPPWVGALEVIDSDLVAQLFPRCVLANAFHTTSLVDYSTVADLLELLRVIMELPEDLRRDMLVRNRLINGAR